MKHRGPVGFVPVMTTQAGSCLTPANWHEAKVQIASFYLSALLMKPGLEWLNTIESLASYVGWSGTLVLNASLPRNADGHYVVHSLYDGKRSYYSPQVILDLLCRLKPDCVILPRGMRDQSVDWPALMPQSRLFFPINDLTSIRPLRKLTEESALRGKAERITGVYTSVHGDSSTALTKQDASSVAFPKRSIETLETGVGVYCSYIAGDLRPAEMEILSRHQEVMIESDGPAYDACLGKVYVEHGTLDLTQLDKAKQFSKIEEHCACPTCNQEFTQAYLHHLFHNTPLLCHRLLIQHNVHFCQSKLGVD